MRRLKLTQGKYALVDTEEYHFLSQWSWSAHKTRGGIYYAATVRGGKYISMHRLLMGFPKEGCVDHRNRNSLDNRRANLRIVSKSVDLRNRRVFKNNIAGCTGVSYDKRYKGNPYRVQFHRDGKMIYLGTYKSLFKARKIARRFSMA